MSDGNRSRLSTLGFLAAAVASLGAAIYLWDEASFHDERHQVEAKEHSDDYAHTARIEAETKCAVLAISAEECDEKAQQAARPNQRDESDLEAQGAMAAWTRAMGKAAIIGMAVGILGLGLIFVTFRETRQANRISREAFNAERRPWLKAEVDTSRLWTLHNTKGQLELPVLVKVTNVGASVALDIKVLGDLWMPAEQSGHGETAIPDGIHLLSPARMSDTPTILFPDEDHSFHCSGKIGNVKNAWDACDWHREGSNALYLMFGITVSYKTAYDAEDDPRRLTQMMFSVHPPKGSPGPVVCDEGHRTGIKISKAWVQLEIT